MVIKKKKINKQKGGELQKQNNIEMNIPPKLLEYFDCIKSLIKEIEIDKIELDKIELDKTELYKIKLVLDKIKLDNIDNIQNLLVNIKSKINYSLFIADINEIQKLLNTTNTINNIKYNIHLIIINSVLSENIEGLSFINKYIKIYIHILFIKYLFYQNNHIFKSNFIELLKKYQKIMIQF